MRIESVTAHAFGPLHDQTLAFAPGLTVVVGDNESAKSSWHAAIYAALCGRRRGRGRGGSDDRRFADLHRPWDGAEWEVSAVVHLADDRRIELRHDLDGMVDCRATDLVLGRDVSNEVMVDGSPDASRWLGLDRRSFGATARVSQADLLGVLERAEGLQEHLQRAASTAGADTTAAGALERIRAFGRERVGVDRTHSTKPLRAAKERLELAEATLAVAVDDHAGYLRQQAHARVLRSRAEESVEAVAIAETELARLEELLDASRVAAALRDDADRARDEATERAGDLVRLRHCLDRATALHAQVGTTTQPANELVGSGRTSAELRAELESLPAAPQGDLAVDPTVRELEAAYREAGAVHAAFKSAAVARQESADSAVAVVTRVTLEAEQHKAATAKRTRTYLAWIGAAVVLVGATFLLFDAIAGALALGIALTVAAMVAAYPSSTVQVGQPHATTAPTAAPPKPKPRPSGQGLNAELSAMREAEQRRAEDVVKGAEQRLRSALVSRGVKDAQVPAVLVETAFRAYEQACAERAAQAVDAGRRDALVRALADRLAAEAVADDASRAGSDALGVLLDGRSLDELAAEVASLAAWVDQSQLVVDRAEAIASSAAERRDRLAAAAAIAADEPLTVGKQVALARTEAASARMLASETRAQAEKAGGAMAERARAVRPVAEAEEEVESARAELAGVERLADTLALTEQFLVRAEEMVHRSVAPVLADSLRRWLPIVTGGRYTDATVDPATLEVSVCGESRRWRNADRLSVGTAEQIYLLLRVALAERLTRAGETCPLLLDDVTVQADDTRTRALLELLLQLSADRQIVLFSQEQAVAEWAADTLEGPRHAVRRLAPAAASA